MEGQKVPPLEQQVAKLERYLATNPKGPKTKMYRAKLKALRQEMGGGHA
ncbi:hypothetical protein [Pelagibius sp.]|nr:hypothetical protein [Pelagibius sp.]